MRLKKSKRKGRQIVHDREALIHAGELVRKRLEGNPNVYRLPTDKAEIFALGEFMSESECQRMCDLIDKVAKPSKAFTADYSSAYRTSYSGDVDPWDPFVQKIQRRFDDVLGLPGAWGETIQGQRYLPGQEFKTHHDWFPQEAEYWPHEEGMGGQRSYTAMVYLNPVEEGGATEFTSVGIAVEPKQGVLLMWNNNNPDGSPNRSTIHAGRPVAAGAKYIITKWYRSRPWGKSED